MPATTRSGRSAELSRQKLNFHTTRGSRAKRQESSKVLDWKRGRKNAVKRSEFRGRKSVRKEQEDDEEGEFIEDELSQESQPQPGRELKWFHDPNLKPGLFTSVTSQKQMHASNEGSFTSSHRDSARRKPRDSKSRRSIRHSIRRRRKTPSIYHPPWFVRPPASLRRHCDTSGLDELTEVEDTEERLQNIFVLEVKERLLLLKLLMDFQKRSTESRRDTFTETREPDTLSARVAAQSNYHRTVARVILIVSLPLYYVGHFILNLAVMWFFIDYPSEAEKSTHKIWHKNRNALSYGWFGTPLIATSLFGLALAAITLTGLEPMISH